MKKWCLLFILLPMYAEAVCLQGGLDRNGQRQLHPCSAHLSPEIACNEKGDSYWDGQSCRKVEIIQACKAQGGEWIGIQILDKAYPINLLKQTKSLCASGFCNICLCSGQKVWNGRQCLANVLPEQNCRIDTWCEAKRRDITVAVTPNFLGLRNCAVK